MKPPKTQTSLTTMSAREMFSLWWKEKWVRALVIALSPIGLVDALFTILLFQAHGAEYEYNPIVRLALTSDWWFVWIIVDIISFVFFAMIAGSYYIHTRSSIFENHTGWLSFLIALRVGVAVYNILAYYLDPYPIFYGALAFVLTYMGASRLLARERDVTAAGFKRYWRAKYDRFHDRIITRGVKTEEDSEPEPIEESAEVRTSRTVQLKRAGYLSMAIVVFVSIPFVLTAVGIVTGGIFWTDVYGDSFYWNALAGQSFLAGFVAVVILISIMMYFIMKAFTATDGAW